MTLRLPLAEVAALCGAPAPANGEREIRGAGIDSRRIERGAVFLALIGERHDGHDHVPEAEARGAAAVVASRPVDTALPVLRVDDTRAALARLAAGWRARLDTRVVAVTGSNGKTTVKEMIAAILRTQGPTLATRGNLNNEIGVPLTLFGLGPEHRYAVVEMGANHHGEIARLTALARPDVALITNAGPAHLEGFGSIEGVSRAKGEIFGGLGPDGVAVINADDRYAPYWLDLTRALRQLTFGLDAPADVHGRRIPRPWGSEIELETPSGPVGLRLPLLGVHNARNALAACAATLALGVAPAAMAQALAALEPVPGRLCYRGATGGADLIDDSYNANPASLRAALAVLAELPGRRWLALGDMAELGEDARRLHREAGIEAREQGVERLYALGPLAAETAAAFGPGGRAFSGRDELVASLARELQEGIHLLVKGSRSMAMDEVVAALSADGAPARREGNERAV